MRSRPSVVSVRLLSVPLLSLLLLVAACGSASDVRGATTTVSTEVSPSILGGTSPGTDAATTGSSDTSTGSSDDVPVTTVPGDSPPPSFWAITDGDSADGEYTVVEVDTTTGSVTQNLGGWGPGDQAIDTIEVGADGSLWLSDCCEPAVGNRYRLRPPAAFDQENRVGYGTGNVASPGGRWVAHSELGQVVITLTDGTGEIRHPAAAGGTAWLTPLTWLDDEDLVIGDAAFLSVLDSTTYQVVSEWEASGQVWDAATRADGNVAALVGWEGLDVTVQVFDPAEGSVISEFDVPDDAYALDYDASGTYLLVVTASGLRWYGPGTEGDLGSGYVAASW